MPAEDLHAPFGIEIDGIDISRGLLDDKLVPAALSLVQALCLLLEGATRTAAVAFDEGALELILARRDDQVRLSLVSLPRPAQVLARDLAVDLEDLVGATARFASEVLEVLAAASEGLEPASAAPLVDLRQGLRRLALAAAHPEESSPAVGSPLSLRSQPPPAGSEAPSLGFDLRDEDGRLGSYESGDGLHPLLTWGHVYLHGPDGEELCAIPGPPWLILRDLADVGLRLLEAARDPEETAFHFPLGHEAPVVEVDIPGQTFTVAGRTLRCPPAALARALFSAALDLCGVLLARYPALGGNPWIASLMDESRQRLALHDELEVAEAATPVAAKARPPRSAQPGPPLALGEIRRVVLRRGWQSLLEPIRQLHGAGEQIWALGPENARLLSWEDGSEGARISSGQVATAGPLDPLLSLDDQGHLNCHRPSGELRWRSASPVGSRLSPTWFPMVDGQGAALVDGGALILFARDSGRLGFRFDPPAGGRSVAVAAGALLALASDNGLLYGVDVSRGEIAWRLPMAQPLSGLAAAGDGLFCLVEGASGMELLGIEGATGALSFRTALPFHEAGALLPVPTGVVVAGAGFAGGEVLQVDQSGGIRWRARPNIGASSPSLLRAGGTLFARGIEGVCKLERGKVRWNVPSGAGGAPALARGLLVMPGEPLSVRTAANGGTPSLSMPDGLPPVDLLLVDEARGLVVADSEGLCVRLDLVGALAVV